MSSTRPLRIGMLGAGMVSAHHLTAWAEIPDATVVAIADPDPARAELRAKAYGIPRWFRSAEELFDAEQIDAVDIVAPVDLHATLCRLAAARNLAIECQKPLCPTFAEAAGIVREISAKTPLMIHENWRYRPVYQQLKTVLGSGVIGDIRSARLSATSSGLIRDADGHYPALVRQPFFASLENLIVFELLVHHLDVLGWLFGPLTVHRAVLSRRCAAVKGEDTAEIVLLDQRGQEMTLFGSFCEPGDPTLADRFHIEGTQGTISFDGSALNIRTDRQIQQVFDPARSYAESYRATIQAFVDGVRAGDDFAANHAAHLAALRAVEDVYRIAG